MKPRYERDWRRDRLRKARKQRRADHKASRQRGIDRLTRQQAWEDGTIINQLLSREEEDHPCALPQSPGLEESSSSAT